MEKDKKTAANICQQKNKGRATTEELRIKFMCAAISGLCARKDYPNFNIGDEAADIAKNCVDEYLRRFN